jgi:hypothetical protein
MFLYLCALCMCDGVLSRATEHSVVDISASYLEVPSSVLGAD